MPKNKGAGGKNRRKGKGASDKPKELVYRGIDEQYAQIIKSLGNGFMDVMCFTPSGNVSKRAHIRGNMRKRAWMAPGDIVLVSVRDYQERTCDILLKYTSDEAKVLRNRGELPANTDINKTDTVAENDVVDFRDNEESDKDEIEVPKQTRTYEIPPPSDSDSESENETDQR